METEFGNLLKGLSFNEEIRGWVTRASRESHQDEKKFHDEVIVKLRREQRQIQDRIDAMNMDKLDGRIDNDCFDRTSADFRSEQARIRSEVDAQLTANRSHVEEGVKFLELVQHAHHLFENQPPSEKRKLLDSVLSSCRWKNRQLETEYRRAFDMLAVAQDRMAAGVIAGEKAKIRAVPGLPKRHLG